MVMKKYIRICRECGITFETDYVFMHCCKPCYKQWTDMLAQQYEEDGIKDLIWRPEYSKTLEKLQLKVKENQK